MLKRKVKEYERPLVHIEKVQWIKHIEGADNIELIGVLGWSLIAKKKEFNVGDLAVYFEIDSLLPEKDNRFKFMESKKYKVKTMKLSKFNVFSQGLALPLSLFPELKNKKIGDDVTKELNVTYYNQEDRERKKTNIDIKEKEFNRMMGRLKIEKPSLLESKLFMSLVKKKFGKEIVYSLFGKESDKVKEYPSDVKKTDETRIESFSNLDEIRKKTLIATEKLDGTSATYVLRKCKNLFRKDSYEYIVCSRNVVQDDPDKIPYQGMKTNVYIEMSKKYNIKEKMIKYAENNNIDLLVIQGEIIGESIQKNPYKMNNRDLYLFNLVINGARKGFEELRQFACVLDFKYVPVTDVAYHLPETMEEIKTGADGYSLINPKVKREGVVCRSFDGQISFKNVSREYLLKHS